MTFKSKVFKLGNSRSIYIPKNVYTFLEVGKEYEFEVLTKEAKLADLRSLMAQGDKEKPEVIADEIELVPDDSVKRFI